MKRAFPSSPPRPLPGPDSRPAEVNIAHKGCLDPLPWPVAFCLPIWVGLSLASWAVVIGAARAVLNLFAAG